MQKHKQQSGPELPERTKNRSIISLFLSYLKKKYVFSVIAVSIWGFLSLASDLLGTLKGEHLCVCFAPFC